MRKESPESCKAQRFILYLSLDTSAWILIAICAERFLAVFLPHRHHLLKTPRRAAKVVAAIVAFQFCFNFPVIFIRGKEAKISDNGTVEIYNCGYSSGAAKHYWTYIHHYLAIIVYCIIPFIVMLTLNLLIIYKLRMVSNITKKSSTKHRRMNTSSMTIMLLFVTFNFIMITTPSVIFTIVQEAMIDRSLVSRQKYAEMELVDAILTLLMYLNHSINFLLYCVAGRRFRGELRALLRDCLIAAKILLPNSKYSTNTDELSNTANSRYFNSTKAGETTYQPSNRSVSKGESSQSVKGTEV